MNIIQTSSIVCFFPTYQSPLFQSQKPDSRWSDVESLTACVWLLAAVAAVVRMACSSATSLPPGWLRSLTAIQTGFYDLYLNQFRELIGDLVKHCLWMKFHLCLFLYNQDMGFGSQHVWWRKDGMLCSVFIWSFFQTLILCCKSHLSSTTALHRFMDLQTK